MDFVGPLAEVENLIAALEAAEARVMDDIDDGLKRGDRLREAVRFVGLASSGSWVGWHSRMYYGDYEEPPVNNSWDSEWGGLHGFSDLWRERTHAEVQSEVERRAGLTLADLATTADRVREVCQPLQREVLTVLSPICDLAGLETEAGLLKKLEEIDRIVSPANYIRAIAPNQLMSRDTQALNQGMQAPIHMDVDAAIVSNRSTLGISEKFLHDGIRLARQVRTKLRAARRTGDVPASSGQGVEATALRRQLQVRSIALFTLLAVAVVAGAVLAVRELRHDRLASASVMVGVALALAALYAVLVDRSHAVRALVLAAAVGGAVATVDQLLSHFE
ncbi:MAG: hypothetical protein ACRDLY_09715 [Thermoleophilaceae bacterium]